MKWNLIKRCKFISDSEDEGSSTAGKIITQITGGKKNAFLSVSEARLIVKVV